MDSGPPPVQESPQGHLGLSTPRPGQMHGGGGVLQHVAGREAAGTSDSMHTCDIDTDEKPVSAA